MPHTPPPLAVPPWAWLLFGGIVLSSLLVDLVAHRGGRSLGRASAIGWSVGWISLSCLFAGGVAHQFGRDAAEDFLAAYLTEKSLSVDNLFVFFLIFQRLKIPEAEQHRVLSWGIFGALVSRGLFIAGGGTLLARWHDVVYLLGAFLIYMGWKTARSHEDDDGEGRVLPFLRRHLPLTDRLHGHHFRAVEGGAWVATPLLLALLAIEATDLAFAVDSVPAVFAVTEEPFLVYSSNVFAILGLRALYLVLAGTLRDLTYLRYGLAAILVLAGAKMVTSKVLHVSHLVSVMALVVILFATVVTSVIHRRRLAEASGSPARTRDPKT